MKKTPIKALFPLAALLALASCASAPAPGTPGMVYDDEGRPLAGVDVTAQGVLLARTDINGRFLLDPLPAPPAGKTLGRRLDFRKEGYEPGQVDLDTTAQDKLGTAVYVKMPSRNQLLKLTWAALDRSDYSQAALLLERARALGRDDAFWALTRAALLLLDPSTPPGTLKAFLPGVLSGQYGELPPGWDQWWTQKWQELTKKARD